VVEVEMPRQVGGFRLGQTKLEANTSWAQVLMERRRIVIRDIRGDTAFAPHRRYAHDAGYVAVQSTPLIGNSFRLLGVLTTFFDRPHHPGPQAIATLDGCARIAALLLEIGPWEERSSVHTLASRAPVSIR
jgi:GAF domain-containing protein